MRSVLALVALLTMTGPHLTATGCTMESNSHGSHAASVVSGHTHDGPDCQALMTCNVVMIEAVTAADVAEPAPPLPLHPWLVAVSLGTTVLTAEPPPPRRRA